MRSVSALSYQRYVVSARKPLAAKRPPQWQKEVHYTMTPLPVSTIFFLLTIDAVAHPHSVVGIIDSAG